MGKKESENIYPLTVVEDRYGGCYSKGIYLAFNLEAWDVPEDVNGSDVDCVCFWDDDAKEYAIGKGDTAQEAIDDLARKLQPAENAMNTGKYAKQMKREGIDPFDEFGAIFDPEAIANLEHIVELTGCKIVLSTTWRNEGIMRMRELWKQRGLPGDIFSMTPILLSTSFQDAMNGEMMGMPLREAKALEIDAWLYQNASKDYRYVILDDEDYFFPKQQEHLVLTDEKEGLTDRKAQNVIWILNN